ncbi:carbohydrate esterase family 12 protein [Cylindrobasidium torrendii FP15055 ss-10]|uniref:Carbohydrate esterase family 12 protein n=1 Tax=Cylindrobasidium torrendii FP15055 ss-10 TaxID=1314674 RepID=A0A0D7B7E5_9AGAR|nr:carbohydrate esterase family 12 protein [Cylindrobasidium torrendii FP15055 ss-10]
MQTFASFVALALAASAYAQTVYLAGDSTMADTGANDGDTAGWGAYFGNYVSLNVVNKAIGGRSARSYTREGRFDEIAGLVASGDYVVIEFGHNDGGSLSTDNGRSDCNPTDADGYDATCSTTYDAAAETVLTFEKYLVNAATTLKGLGANVIISSQTPNNPWESGTFSYSAGRFVGYASDAAAEVGVTYIDHGLYTADIYKNAGLDTVTSWYPNDHTHTSPDGANAVARAFVLGLEASDSALAGYVTSD